MKEQPKTFAKCEHQSMNDVTVRVILSFFIILLLYSLISTIYSTHPVLINVEDQITLLEQRYGIPDVEGKSFEVSLTPILQKRLIRMVTYFLRM